MSWFNVPNLNRDFIGRFDQLHQSLLDQGQVMTMTHPLLVGMGGIGKTELAILLAHHSRPYFRDYIRLIHQRSGGDGVRLYLVAGAVPADLRRSDQSRRYISFHLAKLHP